MKTKIVIGILAVLMLCGVGVIIAAISSAKQVTMTQGDNGAPVVIPAPSKTPDPGVRPSSAKANSTIGEGMWLVGTDVPAGTYKTSGAKSGLIQFCTWTVHAREGSDAEILDFGSSDKTTEQGRVVLKKGQVFDTSGCQEWNRVG